MKTYERVYEILAKSPDFVTGESLAKELGISRTAIWKAIQSLQDQGVVITSVRKKGYHLEKGDILLLKRFLSNSTFLSTLIPTPPLHNLMLNMVWKDKIRLPLAFILRLNQE